MAWPSPLMLSSHSCWDGKHSPFVFFFHTPNVRLSRFILSLVSSMTVLPRGFVQNGGLLPAKPKDVLFDLIEKSR